MRQEDYRWRCSSHAIGIARVNSSICIPFGNHASRHLLSCAALAPLVTDWQEHQPHAEYAAGLRQRHPRKSSFWSRVDVPARK